MLRSKVDSEIRHADRGNGDHVADHRWRVVTVLIVLSFIAGVSDTATGSDATIARDESTAGAILAAREAEMPCRPAEIIRADDSISRSSVSLPEEDYIAIRIGDEPWLIDSADDDSICVFGETRRARVGA
jgi:hypothetical protein